MGRGGQVDLGGSRRLGKAQGVPVGREGGMAVRELEAGEPSLWLRTANSS